MDVSDQSRIERVNAALAAHPTVLEVRTTITHNGGAPFVCSAVKLSERAPAKVRQVCEDLISSPALSLHEPAPDFLVAQRNRRETDFLYREIFEQDVYGSAGFVLPSDSTIIDVGANIGMFSLYSAWRSPKSRILAIEPVSELAQAIRINGRLYEINVEVLEGAAGGSAGQFDYTYYPNNTVMSGFHAGTDDHETVRRYLAQNELDLQTEGLDSLIADRLRSEARRSPVFTLDQILDMYRVDNVNLLKIDVEKSEMDVLSGIGPNNWSRIENVVAEFHDTGDRLQACKELLSRHGFSFRCHQDSILSGTNCYHVYASRTPEQAERLRRDRLRIPTSGYSRLAAELRAIQREAIGNELQTDITFVARSLAGDRNEGCTGRYPKEQRDGREDTPTARRLREFWAELFRDERLSLDRSFLGCGGTSLMAVRFLMRVEAEYGDGVVSPSVMFSDTPMSDVAAMIDAAVDHRGQGC